MKFPGPIKTLRIAAKAATAMAGAFVGEVAMGLAAPLTYRPLDALVDMIEGENGRCCRKIMDENRGLFSKAPGSGHNHQAWPGGYRDHVTEAMNLAFILYRLLSAVRPLPFSLSDVLLVLFLHDLEKPWRYEVADDGTLRQVPGLETKPARRKFRNKRFIKYGIDFTEEQANAMKYVEGELDDYSPERRVMGPLAAFCHCCDVISARIWHDHPLKENDPWPRAGRDRS